MKDYLSSEERNQLLVLMCILQNLSGVRNLGNAPRAEDILTKWGKRNNITKDEQKSLKTGITYIKKFCESVYNRMHDREKENIGKRLGKYDFRIIDDLTLQKIYRDTQNRYVNAVIPRDLYETLCREVMHVNCLNCSKHFSECDLHDVFTDNYTPESTWNLENCRFAYKPVESKPDQEKIQKYKEYKSKK